MTVRAAGPWLLGSHHSLRRVQRIALVVGIVGSALCGLGYLLDRTQLLRSYLVAFIFWLQISLGCMAIVSLNYVTGGAWGAAIRRFLEAGMRVLPLLALAFIPIALGVYDLYPWTRPEEVHEHALRQALEHKAIYLNVAFFRWRAAFYFLMWCLWAWRLTYWSQMRDQQGDELVGRRLELWGQGGLLVLGLTMTFASIDWIMSLEPQWSSTIYGILVMGGAVLSAMAFIIPVAASFAAQSPFDTVLTRDIFHDLGKLLLTFVMVWAYFSFSQFLIIWSANLPEETPWYMRRLGGGWQMVILAIIMVHFVFPFVLLLRRDVKRAAPALASLARVLLLARLVDVYWLVNPAFHPGHLTVHWLDAATVLGLGGFWVTSFVRALGAHPLVPLGDPTLTIEEHA